MGVHWKTQIKMNMNDQMIVTILRIQAAIRKLESGKTRQYIIRMETLMRARLIT
jgi:hypothetical protein